MLPRVGQPTAHPTGASPPPPAAPSAGPAKRRGPLRTLGQLIAWLYRLPLRFKLMVLLSLIGLGPLLIASAINNNHAQEHFLQAVRDRHAESARATATAIGALFERVRYDLSQAASYLHLTAPQLSQAQERLDAQDLTLYLKPSEHLRTLQAYSASYILSFLALPDGRIFQLNPYQHLQQIPQLHAVLGLDAEAPLPRGPHLGAMTQLLDSPTPRPIALQPLPPQGEPIAWLGVVFDVEILKQLMSPLSDPPADQPGPFTAPEWMLLDEQHRIVVHRNPRRVGERAAAALREVTQPSGELDLPRGQIIYSMAPVPGTQWRILVLRDAHQAYRDVFALHWILSAVLGLTLILMVLFADYLTEVFLSPIRALEQGAKMIAANSLGYEIKVNPRTGRELNLLAQSFNVMSRTLQHNRQELATANQHLIALHLESSELNLRAHRQIKENIAQIRAQLQLPAAPPPPQRAQPQAEEAPQTAQDDPQCAQEAALAAQGAPSSAQDAAGAAQDATGAPQESAEGVPSPVAQGTTDVILRAQDAAPPPPAASRAEAQPAAAGRVEAQLQQMEALSDGLMRIGRYFSQRVQPEPVDLNALVAQIREALAAQERGEIRVQGTLPTLHGDRAMLYDLLFELCHNGLHYNRAAQPTVTLRARRLGGRPPQWRIEVEDNGPGLPKGQDAASLFQPFARVGAPPHGERCGVGLTIAQHIAQRHRGTLRLISRPSGCRVLLQLPHEQLGQENPLRDAAVAYLPKPARRLTVRTVLSALKGRIEAFFAQDLRDEPPPGEGPPPA